MSSSRDDLSLLFHPKYQVQVTPREESSEAGTEKKGRVTKKKGTAVPPKGEMGRRVLGALEREMKRAAAP